MEIHQLSFRLAGTALCSLCCRELKGSTFGSLWLADGVRNATRTGAAVATRATPAVLSLDVLSTGGRVTQAEMLLLPITGPTGEHDRLIGLLSLFKPPYWVGHDPLAGFSTTGIRFIDPTRAPVFPGQPSGSRPVLGCECHADPRCREPESCTSGGAGRRTARLTCVGLRMLTQC